MSPFIFALIIFYFLLALLMGLIAQALGGRFFPSFARSILFTPIIAFLFLPFKFKVDRRGLKGKPKRVGGLTREERIAVTGSFPFLTLRIWKEGPQ